MHARAHALRCSFICYSPFHAYATWSYAVAPRSRAIRTVRDDSRDASRRTLAFRGLRALKFAAGLRRTFPFFRLFGDRRRRCNTGTGSAALKSPDYIRAAARGCTVPHEDAHACTVNPMALTSFPPRRPPFPSCSTNARRTKNLLGSGCLECTNSHMNTCSISSTSNECEIRMDSFFIPHKKLDATSYREQKERSGRWGWQCCKWPRDFFFVYNCGQGPEHPSNLCQNVIHKCHSHNFS